MKKLYISPELKTFNVETQAPMLFGSDTSETTKMGGGNKGNFTGSQLSNEHEITSGSTSVWDEEE